MKNGFTLLELIVVIGIFSILAGLTTINLIRPQTKSSLDLSRDLIVSAIKDQQQKSMSQFTDNTDDSSKFGIYFESNRYTLFKGDTYDSQNPTNFIVELDQGISISSINIPSTQLIFGVSNGEIENYDSSRNSFVLSNDTDSVTISLNKYGTVTF